MMYILVIDVGTTGTKTIVLDESGTKKGSGYAEYELKTDNKGGISQNADDWWKALVASVREACMDIDRSNVAADRKSVV